MMQSIIYDTSTPEDLRFKSISDFKWSMKRGAEVEFVWGGQKYGISHANNRLNIYLWDQPSSIKSFETADDALEYIVGNDRLRDVITRVTVLDRTI